MVWIHGGGYVFGSGNYRNYHPTTSQALDMGMVLVSINYRLGPFGWLASRELSADAETGVSGNYGYVTFWLNFHHFDRVELDLLERTQVRGLASSCARLKLADTSADLTFFTAVFRLLGTWT